MPHRLFTAYVLNQIDYMEVNPSKYKDTWEGEIGKIVCLSSCVERKINGYMCVWERLISSRPHKDLFELHLILTWCPDDTSS